MKSALRQNMEADLISSEAARRRFHPSLARISSCKARFHSSFPIPPNPRTDSTRHTVGVSASTTRKTPYKRAVVGASPCGKTQGVRIFAQSANTLPFVNTIQSRWSLTADAYYKAPRATLPHWGAILIVFVPLLLR